VADGFLKTVTGQPVFLETVTGQPVQYRLTGKARRLLAERGEGLNGPKLERNLTLIRFGMSIGSSEGFFPCSL